MKNITITINAESLNPLSGGTNVALAIEWATTEVAKADAELNKAEERYSKAVDAWDVDENPSDEIDAEYWAARLAHEKAWAIKKEYDKILETLNALEVNLLHLDWAMDDNNY